jgi:hypothetical protein
MTHHHPFKKTIKNQFNMIIKNVPKPILEIHENKIKNVIEQNPYSDHHVLFEFIKEPIVPIPENQPLQEDNVVEYVVDNYVDLNDIYDIKDELTEYNPMIFSLRHYISSR